MMSKYTKGVLLAASLGMTNYNYR